MSPEPTNTPNAVEDELARLRTTNADLLKTKHTLKAKIEELEASATGLQERVTVAEKARHDAIVGMPLRKLAEQVSELPSLWLNEFEKRYTVGADDKGALKLLTKDGKPVKDSNDAPVEVTPNGLWRLLTGGPTSYAKNGDGKLFATLMKWNGPNGGGSGGQSRGSYPPPSASGNKHAEAPKLGLGLK
jgi:hypothetical protein